MPCKLKRCRTTNIPQDTRPIPSLVQKEGKDGHRIADHASEDMTKNNLRDHADIFWSDAIPDLDISAFR